MKLVDGFGCERVARLMLSELDSEMLPTESLEEEFLWSDGLKVNKYSPPRLMILKEFFEWIHF